MSDINPLDLKFETLNKMEAKEILGRLKQLQELEDYFKNLREAGTRLLLVNGCDPETGEWKEKSIETFIDADIKEV
jgi:predicted AAA+ superfamily ATPase